MSELPDAEYKVFFLKLSDLLNTHRFVDVDRLVRAGELLTQALHERDMALAELSELKTRIN